MKIRGRLGPEDDDDKIIRIPNSIVEWTDQGIRHEADQRHAELIIKEVGLKGNSKGVATPGSKAEKEEEGEEEDLEGNECTRYRAIVATCSVLVT